MQGYKVYIAGESYAGKYIPYIADAMLNTNDTTYYNLEATMILDPVITYDDVATQVPAWSFVSSFPDFFPFNDTFKAFMQNKSDDCGYTAFLEKFLQFPPPGPMPRDEGLSWSSRSDCDVWDDVANAIVLINPCFDIYQIATTCPVLWDVLGK